MIRQWGTRLWTFPEVLLSPKGLPIKVYTRGTDLREPLLLEKRQFAARVWEDADISRQLIDHYEGTLILSRLELVTLALKCLHKRQTTEYLPGDHSYALMGLLRLRPTVDASDSGFQAFARYFFPATLKYLSRPLTLSSIDSLWQTTTTNLSNA